MRLVSIIVPTYNEEKNIGRLLTSIEKQTYKSVEAIVVDDGSTDDTVRIAKTFKNARVFPRKHAERSVQRNFGASKARSAYVVFLDADMELTSEVIEDCVEVMRRGSFKALVIPEKTTGKGFIATIRKFEREMYVGDPAVEVARFFDKEVFDEFGGYDSKLTGPEDYDLPYRISKKYKIGRGKKYLYHHEEGWSLMKLLKKRYYYGNKGARYASKHPELVLKQGVLIFRKAYIRNWRKFLKRPFVGVSFLVVRILETFAAGLGYLMSIFSK